MYSDRKQKSSGDTLTKRSDLKYLHLPLLNNFNMATKKSKTINIKEYIALAGVTASAITYRLQNKSKLPGISNYYYDADNRNYVLTRDDSVKDEVIKDYFRNSK